MFLQSVNWPTIHRVKDILGNKEKPHNKNLNYDWLINSHNTSQLEALIRYLEIAHSLINSWGMVTREDWEFKWMLGRSLNEVFDCQMKLTEDKFTSNEFRLELRHYNRGWIYSFIFMNGEIKGIKCTSAFIS